MRDSFVFYRSFYEAIDSLPEQNQLEIYKAICSYSLNKIEPTFEGISKSIWLLIKPQIDANLKKYENGSKGGRPKKNTKEKNLNETEIKPKRNLNETKPKANVNDNVNVNVNYNVNGKELSRLLKLDKELINDLVSYYKKTEIEINKYIDEFSIEQPVKELSHLEEKEIYYKDKKTHFIRWLRIQLKNNQQKEETPIRIKAKYTH